jgi:hypothetical protein
MKKGIKKPQKTSKAIERIKNPAGTYPKPVRASVGLASKHEQEKV